jgi:surface protein
MKASSMLSISGVLNTELEPKLDMGHVRAWNTSQKTDMQQLFREKHVFNDDIIRWDTSKVTTIEEMFHYALALLTRWDTSKVTTMEKMFHYTHAFNEDLSKSDTSQVAAMGKMFVP